MTYTIEDYLVGLHAGQWFGWTDSKNKIYANLVIHSSDDKPSESDCTNGVAALQAAYDAVHKDYQLARYSSYADVREQLDLLDHDMAADKGDKTGEWFKAVKKVKDDNAKPE